MTIDVSQSIHRVPKVVNGLPCVTPHGILWLRRAFRRLEPVEALCAQGVPLASVEELSMVSCNEIMSLAGQQVSYLLLV